MLLYQVCLHSETAAKSGCLCFVGFVSAVLLAELFEFYGLAVEHREGFLGGNVVHTALHIVAKDSDEDERTNESGVDYAPYYQSRDGCGDDSNVFRVAEERGKSRLKTDSRFLYTYTVEMLRANSIPTLACTDNLYGTSLEADTLLHDAAAIQTYYEQMWRQRGIDIKYLCFRLPQEGNLVESDVEIPLDDYRSYCRAKRSSKETGK